MEHDAAQAVVAGVERLLAVLLPEEPRVGEARAHHAIGPARDEIRPVRGVHDGEVAREQLVLRPRAVDAEVALVPARDGADDGARELEEGAVERAGHHVRLLHERGVLVDEHRLRVVSPARRAGRGVHALHHRAYALLAVDEHVPLAQLLGVRARARHVERRRREEAVPARGAPRAHARERHGDDLLPQQRDDPLHGAAEGRVEVRPAHRLAEWDRRAHGGERRAEKLDGGPPLLDATSDHVTPRLLLGAGLLLDHRERLHRGAELGRERLGGLGRLAVLERGGLRRADDLLVEIELPRRHVLHQDGEAARRAERAHLAVRQARLRELVGRDLGQRGERRVHERRGELLDADLEQERQVAGGHRGRQDLA